MSSQANKDQFLKQFEHIVDGIKNSKAKVSSLKSHSQQCEQCRSFFYLTNSCVVVVLLLVVVVVVLCECPTTTINTGFGRPNHICYVYSSVFSLLSRNYFKKPVPALC